MLEAFGILDLKLSQKICVSAAGVAETWAGISKAFGRENGFKA